MNSTTDTDQISITLSAILKILESLPNHSETKPVLDTREAAAYLGMSEEWLKKARKTGVLSDGGELPVFIKVGRSVKYLRSDLDRFLSSRPKYEHLSQSVI